MEGRGGVLAHAHARVVESLAPPPLVAAWRTARALVAAYAAAVHRARAPTLAAVATLSLQQRSSAFRPLVRAAEQREAAAVEARALAAGAGVPPPRFPPLLPLAAAALRRSGYGGSDVGGGGGGTWVLPPPPPPLRPCVHPLPTHSASCLTPSPSLTTACPSSRGAVPPLPAQVSGNCLSNAQSS